jgi:hypothetical protein
VHEIRFDERAQPIETGRARLLGAPAYLVVVVVDTDDRRAREAGDRPASPREGVSSWKAR